MDSHGQIPIHGQKVDFHLENRPFEVPQNACKLLILAEREGFEPSVDFKGLRRFSKPLLSTTQPPLRF